MLKLPSVDCVDCGFLLLAHERRTILLHYGNIMMSYSCDLYIQGWKVSRKIFRHRHGTAHFKLRAAGTARHKISESLCLARNLKNIQLFSVFTYIFEIFGSKPRLEGFFG